LRRWNFKEKKIRKSKEKNEENPLIQIGTRGFKRIALPDY
jgi:hypothetical protein